MEQDKTSNYILAASPAIPLNTSLPEPLQEFYNSFKDKTPGEYTIAGMSGGISEVPFGPVTITVDNTRVSVISSRAYDPSSAKDLDFITIQGYAQLTVFDRFYASCTLIGDANPVSTSDITTLIDHLSRTEEERKALELNKIEDVTKQQSFFNIYNDPINNAGSTNGIYIIKDNIEQTLTCNTVFQAIGIADLVNSSIFGLAAAISVNINTFTNAMDFTIAGSLRLASSNRYTIAGEIGLLNGKLNAISFFIKAKIPIATEIYIHQARFSLRGFQEPKLAVGVGGGMLFGPEMKLPDGLGSLQKALFPNMAPFHPVELTMNCDINPLRNYGFLTGKGTFMGSISISASVEINDGNWDAELKAATVRNSYLNGSLTVDYHKRQDNWNLHGNFSCSITLDFASFVGIMVSGGVDLRLNSQDYKLSNTLYNRKDLTISVSGMGKVKLFFSFNISVQKTWVFNLSNTRLSEPALLMKSLSAGDTSSLENIQDVMVCESEDIVENDLPQLFSNRSSDVIAVKSWQTDAQCAESGIVRFQVAAEYTLADSNWRLTYSDGDTVSVFTADNSEGVVTWQKFTHNYYELRLDTPEAGSWTLEILGDNRDSGNIYLDALQDEKFITELKIVEQTDTTIKFSYTAFTGSDEDTTLVRLFAEEISNTPGDNPYSGIIAYLQETENGEFIWEIPEDFCHNAQYRFYISAASSDAATISESNRVETYIARQEADLECSWELAYSADNTNTVTAYITITNTGAESTMCFWELLDHSNNDSVEADDNYLDNAAPAAEVLASGTNLEIKGNSSVTLQQVITITDELRDNPSSLQLSVTKCSSGDKKENDSAGTEENYADDTDEITFSAMNSMYCRKKDISWQAVDGAVSYILHYAQDGNWDECGVYINNISGTSYTLSVAPGEYSYRVIAIGSDGKAIGSWSEAKEIDILFSDRQTIAVSKDSDKSRSQTFSLNDGIYDLNGSNTENFTGTLTLYRKDLVETGKEDNCISLKQVEKQILSLQFVNGILQEPVSKILLDNGDYFWEWSRADNDSSPDSEITIELSGELFSMEQADREIISIGDDNHMMPLVSGAYVETLDGEIGFCNRDAIYQYMTDDGGELSIAIKSGTIFDAQLKVHIYVQNNSDGNFECAETLTVNSGEYSDDTLILSRLAIRNNFYVQVASWDDGQGGYNTDYRFDLSFDAFEDTVQTNDVLKVDGDSKSDWIGYRNEAHTYLLQIDASGRYAVKLQGDAADAVLKVCQVNGNVIDEMLISTDGNACIDNIYLESGNYFVVVESADKGEGSCNTDYTLSAITRFSGSTDGLCWDAVPGAKGYIVEYSTDNFAHVISIETSGNRIDSLALPSGTYQWRVTAIGADFTCQGENIVSEQTFTEPQIFVSNADGNADIFFANTNGEWSAGYAALHSGIKGCWDGTGEKLYLAGKNKLSDIFSGSTDANILVMTDDSNGDALFVDDIYTALPGTLSEQQARIAQIDEIRAGIGDDIVDMTSLRFDYTGDGIEIHGGQGNDVIWANKGSNTLFGDAGNDRLTGGMDDDIIVGGSGNDFMHGGGGDDVFCFGGDWGIDTIEQLDGGSVTLWFAEGDDSHWDSATRTYSDGSNRVTVNGNCEITLRFGDTETVIEGAFADSSSEKIFEDKDKGILA